jgi:hypothetical protein
MKMLILTVSTFPILRNVYGTNPQDVSKRALKL